MSSRQDPHYSAAFYAIAIFAVVPLAVKFSSANPFTIGFFRLIVAAFLLAFYWKKKIQFTAFKEKTFWKLVVIGICFFAHWITYTFSIKISGPSICVLGMATYGVQLIFYGSFFLGYHVSKKNLLCLALIIAGVILVVPSWDVTNKTTLGLILALLSASFYSIIPIMLQKSHEFNQETRIFFQFSLALIGYFFLFPKTEWGGLSLNDWLALLFLAVAGTFVAHTLWSKAVANLPTTTTGIMYYLITPFAMGLSYVFFKEKMTFVQMMGGVGILGAALINMLNQDRVNAFIRLFSYNKNS